MGHSKYIDLLAYHFVFGKIIQIMIFSGRSVRLENLPCHSPSGAKGWWIRSRCCLNGPPSL